MYDKDIHTLYFPTMYACHLWLLARRSGVCIFGLVSWSPGSQANARPAAAHRPRCGFDCRSLVIQFQPFCAGPEKRIVSCTMRPAGSLLLRILRISACMLQIPETQRGIGLDATPSHGSARTVTLVSSKVGCHDRLTAAE